jgi:uncharacterized integral membrane protein
LSKITAAGIGRRIMADGCRTLRSEMAEFDPGRSPQTTGAGRPVKKERALKSKTVAAVAVAFLLIAFGVSNDDRVAVDYLVLTRDSPLILVIGVSALLGALIGALMVRRRSR